MRNGTLTVRYITITMIFSSRLTPLERAVIRGLLTVCHTREPRLRGLMYQNTFRTV